MDWASGEPAEREYHFETLDVLLELATSEGLDGAEIRVVPGNFAARELQRISEEAGIELVVPVEEVIGQLAMMQLEGWAVQDEHGMWRRRPGR